MATTALSGEKPSVITPGFLAWLAFLAAVLVIGLVSATVLPRAWSSPT